MFILLASKQKLFGQTNLYICFHVNPEDGDPPKHIGSLIHKYVLTTYSDRISCNIHKNTDVRTMCAGCAQVHPNVSKFCICPSFSVCSFKYGSVVNLKHGLVKCLFLYLDD